jgi:hypothetical protein
MLSGFPASTVTDPDAQLGAYLLATHDISIDAIRNAAVAYMQGKVKRENNAFAPSCAEFAERCRDEAALISAQRRPKIEPPPPKPKGPPVAPEKMKLLTLAIKGDEQAQQKLRDIGVWK